MEKCTDNENQAKSSWSGARLPKRLHPETSPCVEYIRTHQKQGRQSLPEHGGRPTIYSLHCNSILSLFKLTLI